MFYSDKIRAAEDIRTVPSNTEVFLCAANSKGGGGGGGRLFEGRALIRITLPGLELLIPASRETEQNIFRVTKTGQCIYGMKATGRNVPYSCVNGTPAELLSRKILSH